MFEMPKPRVGNQWEPPTDEIIWWAHCVNLVHRKKGKWGFSFFLLVNLLDFGRPYTVHLIVVVLDFRYLSDTSI